MLQGSPAPTALYAPKVVENEDVPQLRKREPTFTLRFPSSPYKNHGEPTPASADLW